MVFLQLKKPYIKKPEKNLKKAKIKQNKILLNKTQMIILDHFYKKENLVYLNH